MSSREVNDLTPELQILWNKLHDRVRRDPELKKSDVTMLLSCTYREDRSKHKINRQPSEAFEVLTLVDGRVEPIPEKIIAYAFSVGLDFDGTQFERHEKREG